MHIRKIKAAGKYLGKMSEINKLFFRRNDIKYYLRYNLYLLK